jgi:hypothetical protein
LRQLRSKRHDELILLVADVRRRLDVLAAAARRPSTRATDFPANQGTGLRLFPYPTSTIWTLRKGNSHTLNASQTFTMLYIFSCVGPQALRRQSS